jgi:hypothetical protein
MLLDRVCDERVGELEEDRAAAAEEEHAFPVHLPDLRGRPEEAGDRVIDLAADAIQRLLEVFPGDCGTG